MFTFPIIGILLDAIGAFAAGSFYIPFKKVKEWAWESYWLVGGIFSWLIVPWVVAFITIPGLMDVLKQSPATSFRWCFIFGVLWGVGGLTWGLALRYLGISLGMAIAVSLTMSFGTILPPIYMGKGLQLISTGSGLLTLLGVFVSIIGLSVCAKAGIMKDKELPEQMKKEAIKDFDLKKGILVALISGIMSACFAFGIHAGKPIAKLAVEKGASTLWQNNAVFVVILLGGLATNFIWCVYLNIKNKSGKDYINKKMPLLNNYVYSTIAGTTWFVQFIFYGAGTSLMGKTDFASWSIFMSFTIVFSNLWGLIFKEWDGTRKKTRRMIIIGILILILSTFIIGSGSYVAQFE